MRHRKFWIAVLMMLGAMAATIDAFPWEPLR